MGFSWSSFVAQSVMQHVCHTSGLRLTQCLAQDLPTPRSLRSVYGLATDDIIHFSAVSAKHAALVMHQVDHGFRRCGVEGHPDKDVTGALDGVAVGVELFNGQHLGPYTAKLGMLLVALCGIVSDEKLRRMSPLAFASLNGVIQWFNLLNRPLYSCLLSVYAFAKQAPGHQPTEIPGAVLKELLLVVVLSPLWEADLSRPWATELLASDASTSFGYGVSSVRISPQRMRRIARDCAGRDSMATLQLGPGEDAGPPRVFRAVDLGIAKRRFKHVISTPHKYEAHPATHECNAVVLALKWFARRASRHAKRVVILVDARSVLGCLAKGRTSAKSLLRPARRVAALVLATDLLVKYVYISSQHNPADAPSRGVV